MLDLVLNDDSDVAAAAAHDVSAAAGAPSHPAEGHAVAGEGLRYAERSRRDVAVFLRVGGGRAHGLGDDAGVRRGHEAQQRYRLVHALAADLVQDQARLLGRDLRVAGEGAHFHGAGYLLTWLTWADLPP